MTKRTVVAEYTHRHQTYWAGILEGRALARHDRLVNHEPRLRLEVDLAGNTRHRARALGELRGYRQAADHE